MSWCDKVLKDSSRYWEKYTYPGVSWGGENGLFMGGLINANSAYDNTIDVVTISTAGNAVDFGDASQSYQAYIAGTSDGTKCIFGPNASASLSCHYVVAANKSNSFLYGNLTTYRNALGAFGNKSRSIFGSGAYGTTKTQIDYFNLTTGGNASSFGSMSIESYNGCGASDDTRGLFMIGISSDYSAVNSIHYVTISQTSNSIDFGDLRSNKDCASSCCCGDGKVIIAYCRYQSGYTSEIDYVRIQTLSNASEFGVITNSRMQVAACTNGIRGVFGGGYSGSTNSDMIEYITGSYLCNPVNFGNLTVARGLMASSAGN